MPRYRRRVRDSMKSTLQPLVTQFVKQISDVVAQHVKLQVREQVQEILDRTVGTRQMDRSGGVAPTRRKRRVIFCPVAGCGKPGRGPRSSYFCEDHKFLSKEQKAEIKAGRSLDEVLAGTSSAAAHSASARPVKQGRGKKAAAARPRAAKQAKASRRSAKPRQTVTCATPGCEKPWYRPSGSEKKLCYRHFVESGGKPPFARKTATK